LTRICRAQGCDGVRPGRGEPNWGAGSGQLTNAVVTRFVDRAGDDVRDGSRWHGFLLTAPLRAIMLGRVPPCWSGHESPTAIRGAGEGFSAGFRAVSRRQIARVDGLAMRVSGAFRP